MKEVTKCEPGKLVHR